MSIRPMETGLDSLVHWIQRYLELAVTSLRPATSAKKIALHLERFRCFFVEAYGHDRLSAFLRRDVQAWQTFLKQQSASATVNNHLVSLSGFTHWLQTHNPCLFPTDTLPMESVKSLCRLWNFGLYQTSRSNLSRMYVTDWRCSTAGVKGHQKMFTLTPVPGATAPLFFTCSPTVFLSANARLALADYLEHERARACR